VLKVLEIYEKQTRTTEERPDGSEFATFGKTFETRETIINESYIVSVRPLEFTTSGQVKMSQDAFPEGTKFSTLVMDGNSFRKSEMMVVGSFDKFCSLLQAK
tara:strand:+ start:878 stop:1183 length:306 start_codon:yes stop_codon:yes gene_type:complete